MIKSNDTINWYEAAVKIMELTDCTTLTNGGMFALSEAVEDDQWFDPENFTQDDYLDLLKLILAYRAPEEYIKEKSKVTVQIECSGCSCVTLTQQQAAMNSIETQSKQALFVCPVCMTPNILNDKIYY